MKKLYVSVSVLIISAALLILSMGASYAGNANVFTLDFNTSNDSNWAFSGPGTPGTSWLWQNVGGGMQVWTQAGLWQGQVYAVRNNVTMPSNWVMDVDISYNGQAGIVLTDNIANPDASANTINVCFYEDSRGWVTCNTSQSSNGVNANNSCAADLTTPTPHLYHLRIERPAGASAFTINLTGATTSSSLSATTPDLAGLDTLSFNPGMSVYMLPNVDKFTNLAITTAASTVSGNVTLSYLMDNSKYWDIPVGLEFIQGGTVVSRKTVMLDPDGNFSTTISPGTYDIRVSAGGFLSKLVAGVDAASDVAINPVELTNGDVDSSGEIDGFDFMLVDFAFGQTNE